MQKIINLDLGTRSYDIVISRSASDRINKFLSENSKIYSKIFIISDENVANLHLSDLKSKIEHNFALESLIVPAGESSKSFDVFQEVCDEVLNRGADRNSLIIAFGGGVVGDLAGFVASVIMRGIDFIQIPTTLLAAVDSSVGGKTAINSKAGKNLIGAFYQPKLVLIDLDFLQTLPQREMRAGYAEVVKYGLIADVEFFEYLQANYKKIFTRDDETLTYIIAKSCQAKADIVAQDEKEKGVRALLNLGHSFGHVLESDTNYSNSLNHGEAVAIGMVMAAQMSANLGFLHPAKVDIISDHLIKSGLNLDLMAIKKDWNRNNFANILQKDKKNSAGKLNFILLNEIGSAFVAKDVDINEFYKVVDSYF